MRRVLTLHAGLTVVLLQLHCLGGPVAPPPLTDPRHAWQWCLGVGAERVAMASLRLLAIAAGWYLLTTSLATTATILLRLPSWAVGAIDAITVPVVRRIVVSLVAAATLSSSAVAADSPPPSGGPEVELLRRLPDDPRVAAAPTPPATPPSPPQAEPLAAPAQPQPVWTVAPGDHFWSIAERVLAAGRGKQPSDGEVDPYWRTLIEVNRGRLRDPGNPDLIFPGQVFVIPPLPGG